LAAPATSTARAAESIHKDASDAEFIRAGIAAGFDGVPLRSIIQRKQLIPAISNAVSQEKNRRAVEGVVNVLSQLALSDDVDAARIARSEWLKLAEGVGLSALIARNRLQQMDSDIKKWLIRVAGTSQQTDLNWYPAMGWVFITGSELDPPDLTKLRMLRSSRRADNARQEVGCPIRMLALHATAVKDEHLRYIAGLGNIDYLDLSSTQVTGGGLRELDLTRLEILRLDDCPVTDATIRRIDVPSLRSLYLTRTKITDAGLSSVAVAKIDELFLCGTKVTGGRAFAFDTI